MSRTTPPTCTTENITRPPVVFSKMSSTRSRRRQQCMNRLSKPKASAARPSHSRCEWIRESSCQMTRRYSRALGHLHAHERLDGLGIADGMPERADAANAFGDVDELVVIARLDELLEAAMDEADLGNRLDERARPQPRDRGAKARGARVLRAERDHGRLAHATHLPFATSCRALSGARPCASKWRPSPWRLSRGRATWPRASPRRLPARPQAAFLALAAIRRTRATFSGSTPAALAACRREAQHLKRRPSRGRLAQSSQVGLAGSIPRLVASQRPPWRPSPRRPSWRLLARRLLTRER